MVGLMKSTSNLGVNLSALILFAQSGNFRLLTKGNPYVDGRNLGQRLYDKRLSGAETRVAEERNGVRPDEGFQSLSLISMT